MAEERTVEANNDVHLGKLIIKSAIHIAAITADQMQAAKSSTVLHCQEHASEWCVLHRYDAVQLNQGATGMHRSRSRSSWHAPASVSLRGQEQAADAELF